jgi:flagellar biosynthesis chaperone FliJ
MKTPYDAALRLRQREIDAMRVSITAEVDRMTMLAGHRDKIDTSVRNEIEVAGGQHVFSAHAFVARMRAEREMVCNERTASDARLNVLRAQAVDAYGSLSALDSAADRHRTEMLRTAAIAEQSQIDDFSAARFTRTLYAARRAREARADTA